MWLFLLSFFPSLGFLLPCLMLSKSEIRRGMEMHPTFYHDTHKTIFLHSRKYTGKPGASSMRKSERGLPGCIQCSSKQVTMAVQIFDIQKHGDAKHFWYVKLCVHHFSPVSRLSLLCTERIGLVRNLCLFSFFFPWTEQPHTYLHITTTTSTTTRTYNVTSSHRSIHHRSPPPLEAKQERQTTLGPGSLDDVLLGHQVSLT